MSIKSLPMAPFDRNIFCKFASITGLWTDDYIDSLMLFIGIMICSWLIKNYTRPTKSKERKANGKNKSRNYHRG